MDLVKLAIYAGLAIAAMAVLAGIYAAIGNHFTAPLKVELKASQQATQTAVDANQSLQKDLAATKALVAESNIEVEAFKAQSDKRLADSKAALAAAQARTASMATTVATLKATASSPKGNDNACVAVDKLLTDLANDRVRYNGPVGVPSADASGQGSGTGALRVR